jgi:DNA polymerase-3 subunit delta'
MTDSLTPLHPWNRAQADRLLTDPGRLPHALLLAGPAGLGKNAFAWHLARRLLCTQPTADAQPCGSCHSCRLYQAGNHPDVAHIAPAEPGKGILIDQIRALADFLQLKAHSAPRKVAVISPAEAMNLNAANALLKMLEEPPAGSYLFLVGTQLQRLPATIRSRCTRVEFPRPERRVALDWLHAQGEGAAEAELLLDLADGAPLRALELKRTDYLAQRRQLMDDVTALAGPQPDPLACAARWKTLGAARCLAWLEAWVADMIRLGMAPAAQTRSNHYARERLQAPQKQLDLKQLFDFLERVAESRNLHGGPLDELLLLEDILIRWTRLMRHNPGHG